MIQFLFRVRKAFLETGKMTIPRERNPALEEADVLDRDMELTFPDGTRATAYIYHGRSSYGLYYQIRIRAKPSGYVPADLTIGQLLSVRITREVGSMPVRIRLSIVSPEDQEFLRQLGIRLP